MKIHSTITEDRVVKAVKDQMFGTDNPGFCVACGADHYECEPDARRYECDECGQRQVYGAAEVMMMMGLGV